MVKTRKTHKISSSARRSYSRRRRSSPCRGKIRAKCRHIAGCRMADGKKRSFCRKVKSTRRTKATRRTGHCKGGIKTCPQHLRTKAKSSQKGGGCGCGPQIGGTGEGTSYYKRAGGFNSPNLQLVAANASVA
jgi:hypothetical protein